MKTEFSKGWNASVQPRKQRKYRMHAPTHMRRRMLSAHLSKILRTTHKMRSVQLRSGDEVKIMRGKFSGKTGKVGKIDLSNLRIQVDGISREKRTGEKITTWFDPSKVLVTTLNSSDSKRFKKQEVKVEAKEIKENKTKTEAKKENAHKKK